MAMNNVQQNIASEMQTIASEILGIKNRLAVVTSMFGTENMAQLTDADYAELREFAHVTAAEMTAAKNAVDAINTAIGDYSVGTNATKLTKILNRVPK